VRYSGLYLVTPDFAPGRFYSVVESAIAGGVDILQYRDKSNPVQVRLEVANKLRSMCRSYGIPFIVNDDLEVARDSGADGMHVGKDDVSYQEARKAFRNGVVGVSVYGDVEMAVEYERLGADYVSFGPFFPTPSKKDVTIYDITVLEQVRQRLKVPVFVIGGISEENVSRVMRYGIDGVAVISAIFNSSEPEQAAKKLKRLMSG
jgi:thiamine-phosphate pyrophosphorylase